MASMLGDANPDVLITLKANEAAWMAEAVEFVRAANGEPVLSELLLIPAAAVKRDSKLVATLGFDRVLNHKADAFCFLGARLLTRGGTSRS